MEEIDLFLATDDLMPPGIKNDDYDSEGDIRFLEELLSNDSPPLPKNESSNLDHFYDPSSPRPPPEPPDVKVFFDFKPDTGVLTTKVVEGFCQHYVLMPNILPTLDLDFDFTPSHDSLESGNKIFDLGIFIEVKSEILLSRDEFSISFIRALLYPVFDTLLLFSSKNEDKVFKPGTDIANITRKEPKRGKKMNTRTDRVHKSQKFSSKWSKCQHQSNLGQPQNNKNLENVQITLIDGTLNQTDKTPPFTYPSGQKMLSTKPQLGKEKHHQRLLIGQDTMGMTREHQRSTTKDGKFAVNSMKKKHTTPKKWDCQLGNPSATFQSNGQRWVSND
ncbi:hypothetical protein Tco_0564079 [Tanacetum coccineum]